ncbi:TPA_asm: P overlapped [Scutellaria alphacytorhabdovirus 1]|nr:TPA_asm: P overlapped [Scutellaria alphacytorhabdovirus 1]
MKFIIDLLLALVQWYLLFIFDIVKTLWQTPGSLTIWSTVWPHLVIFLLILKTMMTAVSWIILFLRLLFLMIKKLIMVIKMISRILK